LLIGPAATAIHVARSPLWAIVIAIVLGVCYTCLGIFLAANNGVWPVSFFIASISFGVYLPVRFLSPLWRGRWARKSVTPPPGLPASQRDDKEQRTTFKAMGNTQGSAKARGEL
jgi:zinc/manganese transport system permease protein